MFSELRVMPCFGFLRHWNSFCRMWCTFKVRGIRCERFKDTFWDKLWLKFCFIPQTLRQNVSQLAAGIILQTQGEFFFLPFPLVSLSPLPGLTLTACWSEPWLGIFAKLLPSCPHSLPPSSLPPLLPLSLIHTHIWYCLWAAINHVSGASSQKGEASTRSLLPVPVPGKHFQRTHGGGLSEGLRQ